MESFENRFLESIDIINKWRDIINMRISEIGIRLLTLEINLNTMTKEWNEYKNWVKSSIPNQILPQKDV